MKWGDREELRNRKYNRQDGQLIEEKWLAENRRTRVAGYMWTAMTLLLLCGVFMLLQAENKLLAEVEGIETVEVYKDRVVQATCPACPKQTTIVGGDLDLPAGTMLFLKDGECRTVNDNKQTVTLPTTVCQAALRGLAE